MAVKRSDKGVYVPMEDRKPYAPENKHMSRAEYIESNRERKERALQLKELEEELKNKSKSKKAVKVDADGIDAPPPAAVEPAKRRGRPKMIDVTKDETTVVE